MNLSSQGPWGHRPWAVWKARKWGREELGAHRVPTWDLSTSARGKWKGVGCGLRELGQVLGPAVGLRLLSGEEWRSQCLMGPSEDWASLYIGLRDTWQTWERGGDVS